MEKKNVQSLILIVFSSILAVSALSGGNRETGEMGQIQDAMRNLRRADSLHYSYASTVLEKDMAEVQRIEVWADRLSGSWAAEYYTTDEDGTVLVLRQYCDGRALYDYIDWNGYWEPHAADETGTEPPRLDRLTVLSYGSNDITDIKSTEKESLKKISFTFTPEYLENLGEERLTELEDMYGALAGDRQAEDKQLDSAQLAVEQYRQTQLEDILVSYSIDREAVLCREAYTMNVSKPRIVIGEDGNKKLGDYETSQIQVEIRVKEYNQSGILNKIEQCRNEM